MRQLWKKCWRAYCRRINGAKGSISILLALAVSPLLSLTLLLVESARYQSVVSLMQELTNSAAFSALADYDSYLEERYGLLATGQKNDLESNVDDLMQANVDALGDAVTLNSVSASGSFSLGDTSVLKQKLLEHNELTVPVELALEGLNLQEIIDNLGKAMKVDELNKTVSSLQACADLMNTISTILDKAATAGSKFSEYSTAKATYEGTAFTEFQEAALNYMEKKNAEDTQQAEHDATDGNVLEEVVEDFEESSAESEREEAWEELDEKRNAYKEAATKVQTAYSAAKDAVAGVVKGLNDLPDKVEKAKKACEGNGKETICDTTTYEWLNKIQEQINSQLKSTLTSELTNLANEDIQELEEQIVALRNISEDNIPSEWSQTEISSAYHPLKQDAITQSVIDRLNVMTTVLDGDATTEDAAKEDLSLLLDLLNGLLDVSFLYNGKLDSVVSEDAMFVSSTPNLSDIAGVAAMKNMMQSIQDFGDALDEGGLFKLISSAAKFILALVEFVTAMITWVGKVAVRLFQIIGSLPELYNNVLLYGYGAYNLPNRLSRSPEGRKSSLSGFSYEKIYTMAGGLSGSDSLLGEWNTLTLNSDPGSDDLFKAAYGEYLLAGFYSEQANQTATTFNLYMLRLVLDLGPVLKTVSVGAVAGPVGIAIKVGFLLLEAFIDTIMLVNGQEEYLIKETTYCSPAGFVILQTKGIQLLGLGAKLENKLKTVVENHNGTPTNKGILESDYTDHLLLLLMLSLSPEEYLRRMQNIIQMECAKKYEKDFDFELDQAYTGINGSVQYAMNPLFDLDDLTSGGLFDVKKEFSVGY